MHGWGIETVTLHRLSQILGCYSSRDKMTWAAEHEFFLLCRYKTSDGHAARRALLGTALMQHVRTRRGMRLLSLDHYLPLFSHEFDDPHLTLVELMGLMAFLNDQKQSEKKLKTQSIRLDDRTDEVTSCDFP